MNGVARGYCLDFNPTHKWVGYSGFSIIKSLSNSPAVHDKKGRIIEIYPNRPVDYARYNRCFHLSSNSPAVHGWDNDHAPFIQRDGVYAILSNQNAV
ncbi:hypothetical protein KJ656_11940, partial [bacterium]|nr:hypothetical protein [bacterium]